ncbi:uncharacterized protein LOC141841379 [Curcuma longa]|uniref:uncharacterized protein LOC141841379 n=1 Tax=Curcuma longa TaxID=136217 RepID=UPI003D9ECE54
MMLEDFFTLTEMRDGLSSLARVEELISMIQKLNDSSTSNLGDAARQWSTVASVLAATNHKECLNQFVELNGLSYLKKWLQEALDNYTDDNGIVVEELILSLLASCEKLPVDPEKTNASGFGATIELLMDYRSSKIKDKAKLLLDRLNLAKKGDIHFVQSEPAEELQTSENGLHSGNPSVSIPPCSMQFGEDKCEVESAKTKVQVSNVIGCSLDAPDKERVPTCNQILSVSLNLIDSNAVLAEINSSGAPLVSNSCQENLSVTKEHFVCNTEEKCTTETRSQFCQKEDADDQCDAIGSKDVADSVKEIHMNITEVKPSNSTQKETGHHSLASVCPPSEATSLASAEPTVSSKLDSFNSDSSASKVMEHQQVDWIADYGPDRHLIKVESSVPAADLTATLQDHSVNASIPNDISDPQLSTQEEAVSSVIMDLERELNFKSRKNHFSVSSDFLKAVGTKGNEEISQRSGPGLECLDDALEVARQVAIAVEREVVDYREVSCSSPDVNSREASGSHSPVSDAQQDEQMPEQVDGNSSSIVNEHTSSSSPEKGSEITQNISSGRENYDQDIVSPGPKIPLQESFGKAILDRCTFDLNANICSDEPECSMKKLPINVSAPVAVVASSKGAPEMPSSLHFGGEMGWKGSAATSAFRPASPRRIPDGERTSSGPKQKSIFFGIDLNVAESVDEVAGDPTLVKELPASSSLPSGDSCVEVGSKTEMRNWDLNRLGDEDTSALLFPSLKLNFQNGERSLSSASSSSYRHSSFRDFDLNDNPSSADAGSHSVIQSTTKATESFGWKAPHESAIKIMGAEISLTRKDNANKAQQFFIPNGMMQMEPAMFTRPLLPCPGASIPAYAFGGLPPGPAMSVPPTYYSPGNFSYLAETRGMMAHLPQVTSSGLGLSTPRPFHFGAANMHYTAGFGGAHPGFDLNNGMTPPESVIREGESLDHHHHPLFVQGHRGWMEDPSQPSSSTISLKRKEPDSGWELPLNGYKWMSSRP